MTLSDAVTTRLNAIKAHTDPLSQAQLIVELKQNESIPNKVIADYLGMKQSNISHLLRVTKLPEMVLDGYQSKQITFTHLILISRLKNQNDAASLYEEILKNNLNVLQTERRIREILYLVDNFGNYVHKDKIKAFEDRIVRSIGGSTTTEIVQTRIKAKITIEVKGNLETTSTFLESFISRFRSKRMPTAEVLSQGEGQGEPSLAVEATPTNPVESVDPEDDKKYRFDPDF